MKKGLKVNLECVYKSQWPAQKKEKKQQKNSTKMVSGKSVDLKKHGPGWRVDNRNQTFLPSTKKEI